MVKRSLKILRRALVGSVALALVAVMGLSGSAVRADFVGFDPDGLAPTNGTISTGGFGFDTGNALAQSSIAGGAIVPVGSTFQLFYQSRLSNLTVAGGGTTTPNGLNGSGAGPAFEITLVASFTEKVDTVAAGGGAATFSLAAVQSPLSFIRMFYNPLLASNNFTGAGFADAAGKILILSATPNTTVGSSGNFSSSVDGAGRPVGTGPFDQFDPPASAPGLAYAGISSVTGSGAARITTNVLTFDPNFWKTNPIITLTLNAFNNVPFDSTTPSMFFNGFANTPVIPALHGAVNGVSGPDFQFQARASASVTVPEPGSIAMFGIGIVGLLGYGWRRRV